jgi:type III restriction enzyme
MDLFPFQLAAAAQISERFRAYIEEPLMVTRTKQVPFYQNLSAITGSGKTLILAEAIQQISTLLPIQPVVLWLSMGKVVVLQTYSNLSSGKYANLLCNFEIKPLLECQADEIEDSSKGLLLVATVGKFNQRDKEKGDRKIFQVAYDNAPQSLWDTLKSRKSEKNCRRHLVVVYDEGHNLSDQQTKLLLDLEPDALIVASATTKIPPELANIVDRLKTDKSWKDEHLVTTVKSSDVVFRGLVKKNILLGGYLTPMEIAIDEMLSEMSVAEQAAQDLKLGFRPKAIYVSNTNTVDDSSIKEDMALPFSDRKARPILIWRHLVENAGIDPNKIAVYCDLKFDSRHPQPANFNLFSGGDNDYDRFVEGNYTHIIFNLSLQEGWDDPACCFAYIDKSMGSASQVTQLIGRVLRQPGMTHYPSDNLNTAHFYIRTDEKGVFENILNEVSQKLTKDIPDITLTVRKSTGGGDRPYRDPRKEKIVPTLSVDSSKALEPLSSIVSRIHDYSRDSVNTLGKGSRIQILQAIGSGNDIQEEWIEVGHSNKVTARWILVKEVQKLFACRGNSRRNPLNLCDIELSKFDALVEFNSPAADQIRKAAREIVDTYIEHSEIVQDSSDNPYKPGRIYVDENNLVEFRNSIHDGYSDLNDFELEFARELDKTKRVWCRNLPQSGFGIPLLNSLDPKSSMFYPDFLVWADQYIIAIDPKGKHLLDQAIRDKLFEMVKIEEEGPELLVRILSRGKWVMAGTQPNRQSTGGFTVWMKKLNRGIVPIFKESLSEAVKECLKI